MRFGEIYSTCKRIYDSTYEDYDIIRKSSQEFDDASEHRKMILEKDIKNGLSHIEDVFKTFMGNEIIDTLILEGDSIKSIFNRYTDRRNMQKVFARVEKLLIRIYMIVRVGESAGMSQHDLGLEIKMPQTDNITDFAKYVNDLEFIFTKCPYFKDDKESLKLKSVDIGSIWLVIDVIGASIAGGSVLLHSIAAFIDKCYVIKSHKLTCENQKVEMEKAKADQKQKEEIIKTIEKVYQFSVDNAIRELEEVTKIEIKDNEERDRINQCFDRLEKLLDEGLQIYTAIDSPKEVKALFAPIEMRYLSNKDNISKIEDKSNEQQ